MSWYLATPILLDRCEDIKIRLALFGSNNNCHSLTYWVGSPHEMPDAKCLNSTGFPR